MTCLPSGDQTTNDVVSRAFLQENLDSGTRVLVGKTGQEEMQDVRETDDVDGENGGGTGRGVNMTSICGSSEVEVAMVW